MSQAPELIEALPHGPAFRFVSRVEELQPGQSGRGAWEVSGDEPFFADHFPGRPIVPGVLLGEALAQFAGLVGIRNPRPGVRIDGRLAHMDLRFDRPVEPPAEVILHAAVRRRIGPLTHFEVRAEHRGEPAARGTLVLFEIPTRDGVREG